MTEIPGKELTLILVMIFAMLILIPYLQSHTDKDITKMLFGIRSKKKDANPEVKKARWKPKVHNGTKNELTSFVAQLLRFASKNGMRLVAPGSVSHNGETARLTALIIGPGGIVGAYCLGFGGSITPGDLKAPAGKTAPWRQKINGETKTFDNPLKVCEEQQKLVLAAMEKAGISAELTVVPVFTNPQATLCSTPAFVYTPKSFVKYLKEHPSLKTGNLDIHPTALTLADLAGIRNEKKSQKEKK